MTSTPPSLRVVPQQGDPSPEAAMPRHRVLLIKEAQRGNVKAFEQLAREQYQRVYSFALGFSDGPAEAADVAQEALIKAYRKIGSYRFASSFDSWLLQIARNAFRDRIRQRQQHRVKLQRYADLSVTPETTDPEKALVQKQLRQAIYQALGRVDPKFREVVILFDIEGLDYKEIATVCGIPMGTVKSRLRRGRDALCRALAQDGVVGRRRGGNKE